MEKYIIVLANEGLQLEGEKPIHLGQFAFWKNDNRMISLS